MKVLITGGAGFIGSSLADALLEKGKYEIVLVDSLLTGRQANLPIHPNCRFIKCDVNNYNDIATIFLAFRFDIVFHYAAVVGVNATAGLLPQALRAPDRLLVQAGILGSESAAVEEGARATLRIASRRRARSS